jgi:hypothetical protein
LALEIVKKGEQTSEQITDHSGRRAERARLETSKSSYV